jgi:hypothetical protein
MSSNLRYQSDIRQIAGLLMVTGVFAILQPLPDIASIISGPNDTPTTGIPFSLLIGGLCLVAVGFGAVFVGYNQLVNDWGNKYITGTVALFVQTGYIGYITIMTDIGKQAKTGSAFFPAEYGASQTDVNFVAAMGIIAVATYAFAYVGAIAFFLFALYAYQSGHPADRPAGYYRGRMIVYSAVLGLAGLSQLLLGVYLINMFGGGRMDKGPVVVAVYAVNFPAICVFIGSCQLYNSIWGIGRATMRRSAQSDSDPSFQVSMYAGWFWQLVLQSIVQVGYVPGAGAAQATTIIACLSFGLNLMPAYLDRKMRSVPEEIETSYYYDTDISATGKEIAPEEEVENEADAV